jgi:4-methylaminobutanoate oxidase (formaldehyde-forming)
VTLKDVTEDRAVLGVMGPNARAVLARVTDADLVEFPFGSTREIEIAGALLRAARITYVGELGWELHVATRDVRAVYDAVSAAGSDLGLANAGHYAVNSLRLEKGYRAWGSDLSPDDTPIEAGLSFALSWDKAIPFLGRDALLRQKDQGVCKRMASFLLEDPEAMLWHDEPIYRNGTCVGYISSGSYGHTLGGAVGLGYVRGKEPITRDWVKEGTYEVDVAGTRIPARVSLASLYDPKRERILA